MAFDLSKAGFGVNRMQESDRIVRISLLNIRENSKNFYGIRDIEALAESIRESGLLDPIVVTQEGPQKYRIISGHRRYHAYSLLSEESEKWNTIPARIIEALDDPEEVLALIGANATQRELNYDEKLKQEKACRDALEAMKAAGKEVPKRLGEFIAEQLGTSRNEVSRMHSVNENLIPEARDKITAGEMNAREAYELSRKTPEEQKEIIRKPVDGPGMNDMQMQVNEQIEANRQKYADEYRKSMELLDECLKVNLELFISYDILSAENRQDAVGTLKKAWRTRCMCPVCGYDLTGGYDGIQIRLLSTGESAKVSWMDLYDHASLEAFQRVNAGIVSANAPTPEPEIIREQVVSFEWQTGYPQSEGEYVCIFNTGNKETRRICSWKKDAEGFAWFFTNGPKISATCEKWVMLPD